MEPNKFANFDSLSGGGSFGTQSSFAGNPKTSQTDESKLFIGGLSPMTTESSLGGFFSQFGQVMDCVVMRNEEQRSKGFGFVTLASKEQLMAALGALPHVIDGKVVDSKAAIPRSANRTARSSGLSGLRDVNSTRLYLVGVTPEHTETDISSYFGNFGSVTKVDIVKDRATGGPRGFAFVHFGDHEAVDKCLAQSSHIIGNSQCSVRKAVNKDNMIGYQQQQGGGFIARTPRTRGAFRSQPYSGGRNIGYSNQGYGSPAAGAYPGGAYPHINPAVHQYQPGYSGYPGAAPVGGGYPPAVAANYTPAQMWPPTGQPYSMPNSASVQPLSSWGAGGTNGSTSGSGNQPKNFNSNQHY